MVNKNEFLPIVDENGTVIGKASRSQCHNGSKILHPVVHLHVVSPDGRLLLQKRSADKDIQPGKWDTSVGGHVDYGESVDVALQREAAEELGLHNFNPIALQPYVFESEIERELVNPFVAVVSDSYNFKFAEDEISKIAFFTAEQIATAIDEGNKLTPNFVSEYKRLQIL